MADLLDYFERNIPKLHISPKLEKFLKYYYYY